MSNTIKENGNCYPDRIKKLAPYDGQFNAYKLKAEDYDVLFAYYPKGSFIPPHSHDTDNYGVVTKGEMILTINGKVMKVKQSEWYQVPKNTEHSANFETKTDQINRSLIVIIN